MPTTKESPYSVDANLWGRSIEAGPLEDPDHEPTDDVFELTASPENAPDEPRYVEIGFEEGLPTSLDGAELPMVDLIAELNRIAGEHGRVDMIEDRLVGIKSREIYEAPAALAIVQAHRELETLTLTKDVLRFKAAVEQRYAELTYDGLWFTPSREPSTPSSKRPRRPSPARSAQALQRLEHRLGPHSPTSPLQQGPRYLRSQQHVRRSLRSRLYRPLGPPQPASGPA